MTANTYGRQVVIPATNKSGGSVAAGDVVILDSANNLSFTTTTSAGVTTPIGIAQATIASNAVGPVLVEGYAALVNVNASVTRLQYGKTHTVAKQAAASATRVAGTFCTFLTSSATPDALVYPVDLAGAALTNPMTTKGDIILGDTSGVPSRLAAGTSGYILTAAGAGNFPAWAAPASGGILGVTYNVTGGNKSTTSATMADIDATNAIVTFTAPASGNVMVAMTMTANLPNNNVNAFVGLRESTTNLVNGTTGIVFMQGQTAANAEVTTTIQFYVAGISAGAHTYKAAFAVNGGITFTARQSATDPIVLVVFAAP